MRRTRLTAAIVVLLLVGALSAPVGAQFTAQIQIALQTLGIWPYDGSYAAGDVPTWDATANKFLPSSGGGGGGTISAVRFLVGNGTAALPAYAFTNSTGTGFSWLPGASALVMSVGGSAVMTNTAGTTGMGSGRVFGWSSNADPTAAGPDTPMSREGAGYVFRRNGTNAQRDCLANTYTSATNYEAACLDWQSQANILVVGSRTAASGTGRAVYFSAQANAGANDFVGMYTFRQSAVPIQLGTFNMAGTALSWNAFTTLVALGGGTNTSSSGDPIIVGITPTINASSTAGYTALDINVTETAVGSGPKFLANARVGGVSRWSVSNTGVETTTQLTLGNAVEALSSIATNDDPTETVLQGRVATTDATVTTVQTITIATSTNTVIGCYITAHRTGGASGAAEDGAGYYLEVVVKNTAGTVAELAGETIRTIGESQAAWAVAAAATGATEVIQVQGAANNNVTWHSTCRTWTVNT